MRPKLQLSNLLELDIILYVAHHGPALPLMLNSYEIIAICTQKCALCHHFLVPSPTSLS